jgi:hypothetical protein
MVERAATEQSLQDVEEYVAPALVTCAALADASVMVAGTSKPCLLRTTRPLPLATAPRCRAPTRSRRFDG